MSAKTGIVVVGWSVVVAAGCAGSAPRTAASKGGAPPLAACARCGPQVGRARLVPVGDRRQGSSVVLARLADRLVAIAADEDARALAMIDVESRRELSSTPLPGVPSQLLVTRDGRVVVALRDAGRLCVLAPRADAPLGPLESLGSVPVATEPVGLAATPDDRTLVVVSAWAGKVAGVALDDLTRRFEVDLPREPRAIVVSGDGRRAFVSHAVGASLSVVELADEHHGVASLPLDPAAHAGQGFSLARSAESGHVFAPLVRVEPGDATVRSSGYGDGNEVTEDAVVAVVDETTAEALYSSLFLATGNDQRGGGCLLPRASAVDDERHSLLVACFGIDSVVSYAFASAPARAPIRQYRVGSGPSGIAIEPGTGRAVVWSQFDRELSVISLRRIDPLVDLAADRDDLARIPLAPLSRNAAALRRALGRQLFHAVGDPRISRDGRACASCHPEGRDDAITWATPEGPRRTVMLAGRVAGTAPYGWSGKGRDLDEHIRSTFDRLGGGGLSGLELDALIAYVADLAPPVAARPASGEVARGDAIFHSPAVGCSGCHVDARGFTDGARHDVGTRTAADVGGAFDTPSLRFVSSHAPFFHDGRHATLGDLLRSNDDKMGHTKHLGASDLAALEVYLRSL